MRSAPQGGSRGRGGRLWRSERQREMGGGVGDSAAMRMPTAKICTRQQVADIAPVSCVAATAGSQNSNAAARSQLLDREADPESAVRRRKYSVPAELVDTGPITLATDLTGNSSAQEGDRWAQAQALIAKAQAQCGWFTLLRPCLLRRRRCTPPSPSSSSSLRFLPPR